jgi:hypothetical protein
METTGTKLARLAILAATVATMVAVPTIAAAREHHPTRPAGTLFGREATNQTPEIDPSLLGGVAALVAGGLAILTSRRRPRA